MARGSSDPQAGLLRFEVLDATNSANLPTPPAASAWPRLPLP
jgi:hypothetical protein